MVSTAQQTHSALPSAVNGIAVPKTVYSMEFGAVERNLFHSENHACLAASADGLNALNGHASYWSAVKIAGWFKAVFFPRQERVGHCGHEWRSGIYLRYIHWSVLAAREIARRLRDPELENMANDWLAAYILHSALFGQLVSPKAAASGYWKGPGVLVANAPVSSTYQGTFATADCGFRSHETALAHLAVQNKAAIALAEVIYGRPIDEMGKALAGKGGFHFPLPVSLNEIRLAMSNDVNSLNALVRAVAKWKSFKPYSVCRFDNGVVTVLHEFGGSSTQPTEAKRVDSDGTVHVLSCGTGGRKSSTSTAGVVSSSRAVLDFARGEVLAWRLDGVGGQQRMRFPTGNLIFHVEFGDHDARVVYPASTPQPAPGGDTIVLTPDVESDICTKAEEAVRAFIQRIIRSLFG